MNPKDINLNRHKECILFEKIDYKSFLDYIC